VHEVEGLPQLTLHPEDVKKLAEQVSRALAGTAAQEKGQPVLLVAPDLRRLMKVALEPFVSGLTVLGYADIVSGYSVKRVADIE
jgi:type III secretory pathway component EscV